MKKIIAITISLLCISVFTFGQSKDGRNKQMKLDLNKDGVIDKEEFNKKSSQMVKKIDLRMDKTFDRIDANKDGVLDKSEMREARKKRQARPQNKSMRGKKNMRQAGKGKKMMRKKRARTKKQFNNLDQNGNGVINFREFKKAAKAKAKPNYSRAKAKRTFNRMDNNQDGLVSTREFAKAKMKKGSRKKRGQMRGRGTRR